MILDLKSLISLQIMKKSNEYNDILQMSTNEYNSKYSPICLTNYICNTS